MIAKNEWKNAMSIFWQKLVKNEQQLFRFKVIHNCGICATTFYYWKIGKTLPNATFRRKINYIVQTMGYERLYTPKKTTL